MKELVIDLNTKGAATALYFDEFNLGFLGEKLSIKRASEIFFNDTTQKWDIVLPGDTYPICEAVKGFNGYDEARKFEVSWLQECRKEGVDPVDRAGIKIAETIRNHGT